MNQETIKQVKLGSFVLVGLILFIVVLGLIGRQNNVFERTFKLKARFSNIEGLQKGANVWFTGVKIGVVKDVIIESTQSVLLELKIGRDFRDYIKKDAIAKIGSDGLLGNKIVIISGGTETGDPVQPGDMIESGAGLNTDDLIATFKVTNENLAAITEDVKLIVSDIQEGKGSLGNILQDSVMYRELRASIASAASASRNTAKATAGLSQLVSQVNAGEGMVGALLKDTTYENRIDRTLVDVERTAQEASQIAGQINRMSKDLESLMTRLDDPNAPVGMILNDSSFADVLQESMINLRNSSEELDRTLEAAQESFFLRRRLLRKNKKE